MTLLLLIINLAGSVALLLWATRLVRTGVERFKGNTLRKFIRRAGSGRIKAAFTGGAIATLLQSSTAVALLATGFVASGTINAAAGLALLLGADFGSALVVNILSLNLSWLMPLLLLTGVTCYMKGRSSAFRHSGRVILGIGLILLSLQLLSAATLPLKDSPFFSIVADFLNRDLVSAFLVGALFTWLLHSSIASILLVATLCNQEVFTPAVGIAIVLGANLGAGLIAFGLTLDQPGPARSVSLGNLIFRAILAIVILSVIRISGVPDISALVTQYSSMNPSAGQIVVAFHLLFNLVLVILCLPLTGVAARILAKILPGIQDGKQQQNPLLERETALDRDVLDTPSLALASATRECLRVADIIELMLKPVMEFYDHPNTKAIEETRKLDELVNKLHEDIKLYLVELHDDELSPREILRKSELTNFAINMEAAGDVIAKQLLDLAAEKQHEDLSFSPEGRRELGDLHSTVTANMNLALNVLVSSDIDSARTLVEEKDRMREQERQSNQQHMRRLEAGTLESRETSNLHLETLRALRQINAMFASVAYPILSEGGELRSRLRSLKSIDR